jgi:hypothetical protein
MKVDKFFVTNLKVAVIKLFLIMFSLVALLSFVKTLGAEFQCPDYVLSKILIFGIGLLVALSVLLYFYSLLGLKKDVFSIPERLVLPAVGSVFVVIVSILLWFVNACFSIPHVVYFIPVAIVIVVVKVFIDRRK